MSIGAWIETEMFTGIITHQGRITDVSHSNAGCVLEVESELDLAAIPIGASIAHSGVCLTVVEKLSDRFRVEVSPETLALTTIARWQPGEAVNLEASLKLGDELGGHLVFGHVDGLGRISKIEDIGEYYRIEIAMPENLAPLVAVKGSIAVDGISLTVNGVSDDTFELMIIPHSWTVTNLHRRRVGDQVNLEADMLARYVARQMHFNTGND